MILFRSFAFYLAIIGIGVASALVMRLKAPDPIRELVQTPAPNPYENTIAASGIIESIDKNIEISPPQSGLVQEVFVNVGDFVLENAPLFRLDDRDLKAQLPVLNANLTVSEAALNRLRDQLERLESIEDPRAISQDELKTKQHDVIVAEAQLFATEAQLKQIKLLIQRLTVRAPKTGTILQSNIRKGEFITNNSGSSAMVLGDLKKIQVRADIDEQNACRFNASCSATAFLKNNTKLAIPLKFDRIEPYVIPKKSLTGSTDERVDTRVLQVIYLLEAKVNYPLYVGQQVDVFIEHPEEELEGNIE